MSERKILSISFTLLFALSLVVPTTMMDSIHSANPNTPSMVLSDNSITNSTYLDAFEEGLDIRVFDQDSTFGGMTLLAMDFFPNASESMYEGHLLVIDSKGNIENALYVPAGAESPKFINSTTIFYGNHATDTISLWNMETNETQNTWTPMGYLDSVYNPLSDTFMVIEKVQFSEFPDVGDYATFPIDGTDIVEYDKYGNERWRWDGNITFPFDIDEFYLRNETESGRIDWMHSNSLYWDIDGRVLYLGVRNLDCIIKIDYQTRLTDWVLGRYTGESNNNLDLYDINGDASESLFYHAHACKAIGNDSFIIYDNDFWNLTSNDPETGSTRYLEFQVDETAGTASEIWTWNSPTNYHQQTKGNIVRLPNGNTFGSFNLISGPIFVEVDADGEIVCEWVLNITADNIGFEIQQNGIIPFFSKPTAQINGYTESIVEGSEVSIDLSTLDSYSKHYTSGGQVLVTEGIFEHAAMNFQFLPYWQETDISIKFSELTAGIHYLTLIIVNSDGVTSTSIITIEVIPNYLLIFGLVGGLLVVVIILYRRRH